MNATFTSYAAVRMMPAGQVVACPLSSPGAGVGGGERAEDLFWLPGHVRVRGAAFMLEDRDDSVGGELRLVEPLPTRPKSAISYVRSEEIEIKR
jgi:hypothetical protein